MKNSFMETREIVAKPLVTIVGVTGKQGRSAAYSLLASGAYRVRGVTRHTHSPEAQKMAALGLELINLPLTIGYQKQYESAFRGTDCVFFMTPNIVPPATHEFELGKQLADAAVQAGVHQVIFSSLENVDQISGGRLFAPHFTDKARIEQYIRSLPVISSFIYLAFFYTNLMEFYTPVVPDGRLVFPIYLPKDFPAPFTDPLTATGPAVLEICSKPEIYAGQSLPVIGDIISPQEMIDIFTKVTGKAAQYSSAYTREALLGHFPALQSNPELVHELLGMVQYAVEYGYFAKGRDLTWSRKVNPNSLTWEQFLIKTQWQGNVRHF